MSKLDAPIRAQTGRGYTQLRLGIELEYENYVRNRRRADIAYWTIKPDPSLRNNGIEFVTNVAIPADSKETFDTAYKEVQELITSTKVQDHLRCGVHVHTNVTHLTMPQLLNYVYTYILLEGVLFRTYAKGREDNHFCVPLANNDLFLTALKRDASNYHNKVSLRESPGGLYIGSTCKYNALNFSRTGDLGTAEWRQHRGTTNVQEIKDWVAAITRFVQWCEERTSMYEGYEFYEKYGLKGLCDAIDWPYVDVPDEELEIAEESVLMAMSEEPKHWKEMEWKPEEPVANDPRRGARYVDPGMFAAARGPAHRIQVPRPRAARYQVRMPRDDWADVEADMLDEINADEDGGLR